MERFARDVLVIVNGKLAAAGDFRTIRERMDEQDHIVRIRCDDPRRLAAALVVEPVTTSIRMADGRLIAETNDVRQFGRLVPEVARREGIGCLRCSPSTSRWRRCFRTWSARKPWSRCGECCRSPR